MSNFYKISLAALVAAGMAVFGASNSFAEVAVSGGVDVGFGQATSTPADGAGDASSNLSAHSQANLDFSGGNETVSAKYRLRVREDDKALKAVRHHVHWQINEQMGLTFMGQSFGIPGTAGGHLGVGYFDNDYSFFDPTAGPIEAAEKAFIDAGGTQDDWDAMGIEPLGNMGVGALNHTMSAGFENTSGLDFNFNLGNMSVGAAILTKGPGKAENQTILPHFSGNFGAISVGIAMANGSGKSGTESVTDSELQAGLKFSTDAMTVGFGIGNYTDSGDNKTDFMELGLHMAGVEFKYATMTADTSTLTDIAVGYRMPVGESASMVPAFATSSWDFDGTAGGGATWMGVQLGTGF